MSATFWLRTLRLPMATLSSQLNALRDSLPTEVKTIEDEARATLYLLIEAADGLDDHSLQRLGADPARCPNCGDEVLAIRSPYCGVGCRETSAFVRQLRAGLADGAALDSERQIAFGQTLWHLLGGGRPLRLALIPKKVIAQVIAKGNGVCTRCGGAATTVDHIGTACNRPINLAPVCDRCTTIRAFGDAAVVARANAELMELAARIAAPAPLRVCDDAATWNWREFVNARQAQTAAR